MSPRRPRTLRSRLLVVFLTALAVAVLVGPVSIGFAVRGYLDERAQDRLQGAVTRVGGILSGSAEVRVPGERLDALLPPGTSVVALGPDGATVALAGDPTLDVLATGVQDGQVLEVDDDGAALVTAVPTPGLTVVTASGDVVVARVLVAVDLAEDRELFRRIVRATVAGGGLGLLVVGLGAAALLRARFSPLERMAAAARTAHPGALSGPAHGGGREIEDLAAALDQAFAQRAAAEERLRTFVADASHELRTPLATVTGWLDLYVQGGLRDPGALDVALQRIEAQTGRMRMLVDDLGLLARLDAGRDLDTSRVDLADLTREVVADAAVVSPDAVLTVVAPASGVVVGDAHRLAQVLRNLVGNAVQHNPSGTSVRVEVSSSPGEVVVRVSDDGVGIAEQDLPRVFERFHRGDPSRTRDGSGGSGLGLAIVAGLVEAHHGSVTATSTPGTGTTVEVRLPAAA